MTIASKRREYGGRKRADDSFRPPRGNPRQRVSLSDRGSVPHQPATRQVFDFVVEGAPVPVQMISYDLRRPGQDYAGLFDAIEALGPSWHCLQSVWLINTPLASGRVRDVLRAHLHTNDSLLVAALSGDWATVGLSADCANWLREFLAA